MAIRKHIFSAVYDRFLEERAPSADQVERLNKFVPVSISSAAFALGGIVTGSTVLQMLHTDAEGPAWNDADVDFFFSDAEKADQFSDYVTKIGGYEQYECYGFSRKYRREGTRDINIVVEPTDCSFDITSCMTDYNGSTIVYHPATMTKVGKFTTSTVKIIASCLAGVGNMYSIEKLMKRVTKYASRGFTIDPWHMRMIQTCYDFHQSKQRANRELLVYTNNIFRDCLDLAKYGVLARQGWSKIDYINWKESGYTSEFGLFEIDDRGQTSYHPTSLHMAAAKFVVELDLSGETSVETIKTIIADFPRLENLFVDEHMVDQVKAAVNLRVTATPKETESVTYMNHVKPVKSTIKPVSATKCTKQSYLNNRKPYSADRGNKTAADRVTDQLSCAKI